MSKRVAKNPYARAVDPEVFTRNFLAHIQPMPTPELLRFLAECESGSGGTEGEALIVELIKGERALRDIARR